MIGHARVLTAALTVGVCAGVLPAAALAQGFSAPNIGSGWSGPAADDPAAVYWNPAMLTVNTRPTILAGGSLIVGALGYTRTRQAQYQRSDSLAFALPIPADALDPSRSGQAAPVSATPFGLAPTFFGAVPLVPNRVVAGLGVYAPYAALLDFGTTGAQRFQVEAATIVTVNVTPSIAVRISDALSVGAGVSYVFGYAELSKVQDFAALGDVGAALAGPPINQRNSFGAAAPPGVRELDVLARPIRLRTLGNGFTFNAGIAVHPTRTLTFGLSYVHSTPMTFTGSFQMNMNDPFFTRDLVSQGLAFKPLIAGDATLSFTLPRSVNFGADWSVTPRVGFGLTVVYTTWSQVDAFDVRVRSPDLAQPMIGLADTSQIRLPRRWNDTLAVELTGRYALTDRWTVWLTGGYHSPASPDTTVDTASPDGQRIVAGGGARWQVNTHWRLFADAEVQTILPRHVTTSDYDLGNGDYTLTLVNLGFHGQYTF